MLLSPESEAIVKATAGVVAENAEAITARFYPHMFEANPELLKVFNKANQAIGEQPKALAASVVAYAVHLIDPNAPDFGPIMQRIAHKHVSLGIKATDYTIVGRHLMWAVGDVLGGAVTPEVAAAWDEVYWLFGAQLIAEEAKLYALGGTDPDQPWRKYKVVDRDDETEGVFSLELAPVEGDLPTHHVGQYVAIAVDLPGGERQPRQYTISGVPGGKSFRLTIKRAKGTDGVPDGQVSNWLGDNAQVGTILDVSQPSGDVILDQSDEPLVLVSAGIGITPMAAILEDLVQHQPKRTVRIYHADRNHGTQALYQRMLGQSMQLKDSVGEFWYEEGADLAPTRRPAHEGYMDLSDVEIPDGCRVFMCGSLEFMANARRQLLARGVPADRIDYEVFGPDLWARQPQ
ncbi:globin domain-containing protein [Granulicoccus sp. GXG6511]|uniref:globin domain-containing protein n=1 Tax=Granulicoccus sp. GXG6511 TaxID=3381351 RepID=UPI003D7D958C